MPPRLSAPATTGAAPSTAREPADAPAERLAPAEERRSRSPRRRRAPTDGRDGRAGHDPGREDAEGDAEAGEHADPVPAAHLQPSVLLGSRPTSGLIGDDPGPMHPLAALRRLPRYPLEVFFWTRLLIWGGTLLAYLVFEAQYAQPLHTGGAEDVVEHDVGWAVDVWGRWDSGWFLADRPPRLRRPGPLDRVLPGLPAARAVRRLVPARPRPARRGARSRSLASAVAFVLLWRLVGELAGEATAADGPSSIWRSSRRRSFCSPSTASRSTSLLSVAAFLLARRRALGLGRRRDRARRADTRLGGDAAARARPARLALAEPARRARAGSRSRCRSWRSGRSTSASPTGGRSCSCARSGPAGTAISRSPARSAAPGTRSSRAGAASASSSRARATTTSRAATTARCTAPGLNLEQLAYARPPRRPRRLRLAGARRRLRRLRAREPRAAVLRSAPRLAASLDAAVRPRRLPGLRRPRPARLAAAACTRRS